MDRLSSKLIINCDLLVSMKQKLFQEKFMCCFFAAWNHNEMELLTFLLKQYLRDLLQLMSTKI